MTSLLKQTWAQYVRPLIQRPKRVQVAALCYRQGKDGDKQVLLITSLDRGRWILPKGWPMDGLDAGGAALQEAWEEAGVVDGKIAETPLGSYEYQKRLDTGGVAICKTQVFPVAVGELAEEYPDMHDRKRKWVSPEQAAGMVEEPQLQDMLRRF